MKRILLVAALLPTSALAESVSSFRFQYSPTVTSTELSYKSDTRIYDNDFLLAVEEAHSKTVQLESMLHMLELGYVFSVGDVAVNLSSSLSVTGDFESENNQLNAEAIQEPIFQQEMTSFTHGVTLKDVSRYNGQASVAYHFGSFNVFAGFKVEQSKSTFDLGSSINIGEGQTVQSQSEMTLDDVASGPFVGINSVLSLSDNSFVVLNATISQFTGGHLILDGEATTFNETTDGTGYSLGAKWTFGNYNIGAHYKGYESDDGGELQNSRSDIGISIGYQFL